MKKLIFIILVLVGFASCESPIENGDLVYLSVRETNHLSLKNNNGFQCSNEEITPLVYIEMDNGTFILKTEEGLNVGFKKYYLSAIDEEPAEFKLDKKDGKRFIQSMDKRYLGCNGKEVYGSDEPYITIHKY